MPGVRPTSSSISVPTGRPLISRILSPSWMAFRTSGLISIPRTLEQHSTNTCMWALALQRDRRWRRTGSRSYITWTLKDLFLNAWLCFLFCAVHHLNQGNLKFQSGSYKKAPELSQKHRKSKKDPGCFRVPFVYVWPFQSKSHTFIILSSTFPVTNSQIQFIIIYRYEIVTEDTVTQKWRFSEIICWNEQQHQLGYDQTMWVSLNGQTRCVIQLKDEKLLFTCVFKAYRQDYQFKSYPTF